MTFVFNGALLETMKTIKDRILSTRGKFFVCSFVKKNGEHRRMVARLGVRKYLRGGENMLAGHPHLVTVWDTEKRDYRCINTNTVTGFKCGKL